MRDDGSKKQMLDFLKCGIIELVLIMYYKDAHNEANIKYIKINYNK